MYRPGVLGLQTCIWVETKCCWCWNFKICCSFLQLLPKKSEEYLTACKTPWPCSILLSAGNWESSNLVLLRQQGLCSRFTDPHTETHTHRNTQAILWWSWPVQMASGPLYIIQACLHGVSGGSLRCQDYFAHSQKQWKNCGPLCMLPAKCCFQNQLTVGSSFYLFIYCQHSTLFHFKTVFSLYFTLFILLYLSSMVTSEVMAQ